VLTAISNEEVSGKEARVLSDDEIISVLSREAKKRRVAEEEFAKAFNKVAEDNLEKDGHLALSTSYMERLSLKGQFKGLPESKLIIANTHEKYFFRKISAYNSLSMFGSICLLCFGFYLLFVTIQLKFFSQ
jgi:hypothetical protein